MWDLIVSVPDHCLSFYFPYSRIMDIRRSPAASNRSGLQNLACLQSCLVAHKHAALITICTTRASRCCVCDVTVLTDLHTDRQHLVLEHAKRICSLHPFFLLSLSLHFSYFFSKPHSETCTGKNLCNC